MGRPFYFIAGVVFLALGIIGAFLPLMPTTIFLILATWCFARSSTRLEKWLLDHPRYGKTLRDWQENGAVSRRSKQLAAGGMAIGFILFWVAVRPALWLWLVVAAPMAACAWFVLSRPEPPAR